MTNAINQTPYLRTSRLFPEEIRQLSLEVNKSYVDIANAVNNRTIGLFPSTRPAFTGNSWFIQANKEQQTLRQVYPFTINNLSIPHGINISFIYGFVSIYGTFVDSNNNWYNLPYVDVVNAMNQINLVVNSTNIQITIGSTTPIALQSGFVVLEWLSQV